MTASYESEMAQGRLTLANMLPRALEVMQNQDGEVTQMSGIAKGMMGHLHVDSMEALLIRPARLGGWLADLVLRNMPEGVSNMIGTPISSPHGTREKAEEYGLQLIILVLTEAGRHEIEPPVFELYGISVTLVPRFLEMVRQIKPLEYGPVRSMAHVAATLTRVFGDHAITIERIAELDLDRRSMLLSALHIAAVNGVLRYPPNLDGPPEAA